MMPEVNSGSSIERQHCVWAVALQESFAFDVQSFGSGSVAILQIRRYRLRDGSTAIK